MGWCVSQPPCSPPRRPCCSPPAGRRRAALQALRGVPVQLCAGERPARPRRRHPRARVAVREAHRRPATAPPGRPVRARRRPRPVRHGGVRRRRARGALAGLPPPRPDRLRPARHRPLRSAALPRAGALEPVRRRAGRRHLRAAPRRAQVPLHEPGLGGGHRVAAGRPRPRQDRDLRDLLRREGRARLRAHLSRARGAAGARLGARGRRARPVLPPDARGAPARAALALPFGLPLVHRRPPGRPGPARPADGRRAGCAGAWWTRAGACARRASAVASCS